MAVTTKGMFKLTENIKDHFKNAKGGTYPRTNIKER